MYNQEAGNNIIVLDNRKICFLKEIVILHNISFGQSAACSFQNICQTGNTQNTIIETLKIKNRYLNIFWKFSSILTSIYVSNFICLLSVDFSEVDLFVSFLDQLTTSPTEFLWHSRKGFSCLDEYVHHGPLYYCPIPH